jgi:hypothetical protein
MLQRMTSMRDAPVPSEIPDMAYRPVAVDHASVGENAAVLADIYSEAISLAVWRRSLSDELEREVRGLCDRAKPTQVSLALIPDDAHRSICDALGLAASSPLCADIAELVDMFSELFACSRVGLRFTTLDRPMCPRFHVDRLGCRLITTYAGVATEWLPHTRVRRDRLGIVSAGIADHESGVYRCEAHIQRLRRGDVALLKGEGWEGNEGRGLVHRSPAVPEDEKRVLLTLDIL